jgi:hypothetical protein
MTFLETVYDPFIFLVIRWAIGLGLVAFITYLLTMRGNHKQ